MTADLLALAPVVFAGAMVQSALGFGFSLVVAPLLLLRLEPRVGLPLLVLMNVAISAILFWPLRRHVPLRPFFRLSGGALAGIPLGFWIFVAVGDRTLRLTVGGAVLAAVILLAFQMAVGGAGREPGDPGPGMGVDLLAGGVAGALTTSIGVPGPAVAVYATWAGLERDALRALILNLFLLAFGATLLLQVASGYAGAGVWAMGGLLLPAVALGIVVGHRLARRLDHARFHALVLALLAVSAATLLYSAVAAG